MNAIGTMISGDDFARYYVLDMRVHRELDKCSSVFRGYGGLEDSEHLALLSAQKAALDLLDAEETPSENRLVVLVSARSVADVMAAYPSYMADTERFTDAVKRAVG